MLYRLSPSGALPEAGMPVLPGMPIRSGSPVPSRPPCPVDALRDIVAAAFGVPADAIAGRSRGSADVAFARQTAMYLAHVAFGASFSEIGRAFGRDRTTAAHACRVVEERRDDPRVEILVEGLERRLAAVGPSCPGRPA